MKKKKKIDIAINDKDKTIAKGYKLVNNEMKGYIEAETVIYIVIILNNAI